MLRVLIVVTALGAALWSGWWWVGATGVERAVAAAAMRARADGWEVEWSDLAVRGFPSRFDTTVTQPAVAPPDGAWRWTAPFVQVFALSYRPNHLIAVLPPRQSVATRFGTATVEDDDLRASLRIVPGLDAALAQATATGEGIRVAVDGAPAASVARGQVALRRAPEGGARYDLALSLEDVGIDAALASGLDPEGLLPRTVRSVTVDASATLDRVLDRHLEGPAGMETLEVDAARVVWGGLDFTLSGTLAADAAGLADGTLTLAVGDVDALEEMLEPFLPEGQLRLAGAFLRASEGAAVPLAVSDGVVRFGPLPLGTLPPMRAPGR